MFACLVSMCAGRRTLEEKFMIAKRIFQEVKYKV